MKNNNEHIIIDALKRLEHNETEAEILASFPDAQEELGYLFKTIQFLHNQKAHILPRKELLERVFAEKQDNLRSVTKSDTYELAKQGGYSRTPHKIGSTLPFMNKARIWLPLGVVAVAVFVFIGIQSGGISPVAEQAAEFAGDPFDLATLEQELSAVEFDSEFESFFEEEQELLEIEAALAEF
jgi:hypothetical protein